MTYPRAPAPTLAPPPIACPGWKVGYGRPRHATAVQLPAEVSGFVPLANKSDVTWDPVLAPGAVTYDVLRGNLRNFPVGVGPGETCLAPNTGASTASDPSTPAVGQGYWYVVRLDVAGCGVGSYGSATGGAPRVSAACP